MANRFFPNYETYKITSPYGMRTLNGVTAMHNGIDLVAKATNGGSRTDYITSHGNGKVISCGFDKSAGYFANIGIDENNYKCYYHMKAGTVKVKKGDIVKDGQIIGFMGSTGNSTGAHLHFGIKVNGKWINPAPYLDKDYNFNVKVETTFETYTIKRGDTLSKIAERYNTTVGYLADINKLENINLIITGHKLKVPVASNSKPVEEVKENKPVEEVKETFTKYTVKRGDTLWGIAKRFLKSGIRYREIKELNGLKTDTIFSGQVLKIPLD